MAPSSTTIIRGSRRPGLYPFGQALAQAFSAAAQAVFNLPTLLVEWQKRDEMRRHLANLDDRMLADMGLTRAQASREATKPFWLS